MNNEYKTCDKCCYDILDDQGDVLEHYCEDDNLYLPYGEYPFSEGDDYYTIEDGEVIWSCWDDVSEEMHDENPNKQYFTKSKDAVQFIRNQNN